MNQIIKTLLSLSFCLLSIACFAQDLIYNIQFFDQSDGLSGRVVFSVNQDDRGLIWLGTNNGLNLFDGQKFKVVGAPNSRTASGNVFWMEKSSDGFFWIQKGNEQAFHFDPYKEELIPIPNEKELGFLELEMGHKQNNNIWFHNTKKQIFYLDDQQTIRPFINLKDKNPKRILGTPWKTVLARGASETTRVEINEKGDTLRTFDNILERAQIMISGTSSIRFVVNSTFMKEKSIGHYCYALSEEKGLEPITLKVDGVPLRFVDLNTKTATVLHIAKGQEGKIWLVARNALYLFDEAGNLLKDLTDELQNLSGTTWNANESFIDDHNRLWIATGVGLYLIEAKENPFQIYLDESGKTSVRGITAVSEDVVFIANYHECRDIHIETEEILANYDLYGLGLSTLNADTILLGLHSNSINLLDRKKGNVSNISLKGISGQARLPYYDPDSRQIYIGTSKGLWISKRDLSEVKEFTQLNGFEDFAYSNITHFYKNKEGLWLATQNGLFLLDQQKGVTQHINFPNNNLKHTYEDATGDFWLATEGGGLIQWDRKNNLKKQYTTKDGLSDDVIYAVYEDEAGYLWLPSNNGLMRFEKNTGEVIVFQAEDGIAHQEFNTFAHFQAEDGRLYFGGLNGVTAFYPNEVKSKENDAPFIITKFEQLDGESGELINKTKEVLTSNEILLNPGDKFFTLNFSLLDYVAKDKIYAWKIKGIDADWTYQTENAIRINALSYGDYVLEIKAKGSGGQWAKKKLEIPIHVQKPFYLQTRFIGLMILLGALLIWGFIRYRTAQLRKRAEALVVEVFQRTQTIREQNMQLEVANQFKDKVLALVAHDLRAPLITLKGLARKIHFLLQKNRIEDVYKLSHVIDNSTDSVTILLDNIMSWALIQKGQFEIEKVPLSLSELIHEVMDLYKNTADAKAIALSGLEKDIEVYADRNTLLTVFRNLLNNAIKFTEVGGSIHFSAFKKQEKVCISINDTGIGIPPDLLSTLFVFDRKKRVKGTKGEKGTGFGLMLCQELVHLHGGRITVQSTLGEGSQFSVILPNKKQT